MTEEQPKSDSEKTTENETAESKYSKIAREHGELGEFVTGEFQAIVKAALTIFDELKSLQKRIGELEHRREVSFQIGFGNGCSVSYTCDAADLKGVQKIAAKFAENLEQIYRDFLNEHVKVTQQHQESHDEPEGYQ